MNTGSNSEFDVIVTGAGPVGMISALILTEAGAKVCVVEQEPQIIQSPRAAVYFPATLAILDDLELLDELLEIGFKNSVFGMRIPEFDFHTAAVISPIEGVPYDYQLHAGQHDVARVAMEKLLKLGGTVCFNHEVQSYEESAQAITVKTLNDGVERDFTAKWLVGADGARSTVRKLADIEFEGHTWPERFVATNVKFPFHELGYDQANFVCDPVNMAVIAQLDRDGLWRCTYLEDSSLPVENYEERIPGRYEYFMQGRTDYEIVSSSPYMLHQRASETLHKGRVLLVGDAAHATNPCGGLGLTSGIWTGAILADVLGAVLRGEEGEEILQRFSDERRRIFWDIVSPAATENKRMLQEKDPETRKQDHANLMALNDDAESSAMLMLFAYRVIGDTLREKSRWAGIDPSERIGLDISGRGSQIH